MKDKPSLQKLRGGYYTPSEITDFLSEWAIKSCEDQILEPSCGDGNFLIAIIQRLLNKKQKSSNISHQLNAVEIDKVEFNKSIKRIKELNIQPNKENFFNGDFFSYFQDCIDKNKKFDAVIGNPPFIRYQDFPKENRDKAFDLMSELGFKTNRLTNIWVPFVALSSYLLKTDGRLAMVVPAELFQVSYAGQIRKFLSEYFSKINIITFSKLVFSGIQQEVVLLLAEKNTEGNCGIRTFEIEDLKSFKKFSEEKLNRTITKPIDHDNEKWIKYFLDNHEIQLLRKIRDNKNLICLGDYLNVDVGVVTGLNDFFVIDEISLEKYKLLPHVRKIVTRSMQLKGIKYTDNDFQQNNKEGFKTFLFYPFDEVGDKLPREVLKYIKYGESKDFHKGYKCRIRKIWYKVPSIHNADIFCLRQIHQYPKLINNFSSSTCTDTIHRARIKNNIDKSKLCGAFINSLTFAFSEVTGRSYGGGVMTFEPSEIEKLLIPKKQFWDQIDPEWIDTEIRKGNVDSVLNHHDEILLSELRLNKKDIQTFRKIWIKLKNRRINRK